MATGGLPHADVLVRAKEADKVNGDLFAVAKALCPHSPWTDDGAEVDVKIISGGITNLLYRVSCSDKSILVRVFGDKTEVLIDREKDNTTFAALSDCDFGPHFYGTFTNGRVEGWIDAKPLEPPQMGQREPRDMPALIAPALAHMHSLAIAGDTTPTLWATMDKWLGMAKEVSFPEAEAQQKRLDSLNLASIDSELAWLKAQLPSPVNEWGKTLSVSGSAPQKAARDVAFESVFSHNDLLAGNILDVVSEGRVQIIDFEYGSYSLAVFDLANHMCEYAGFDFDLDKWFPDAAGIRHFVEQYLAGRVSRGTSPLVEAARVYLDESCDATEREAFFSTLVSLVQQFTLCSHLYWGMWAVIQARYSPIDFDFMDYARLRVGGFWKHKKEFFPEA